MATLFGASERDMLFDHLQACIDVELFTIPLYLTGVYSFTDAVLNPPSGGVSLWGVQQKTLSVAVQEMYHLQQACNIVNAFGLKPRLDPPLSLDADTPVQVPHLDPDHKILMTQLDNLPKVIEAMIAVETPDEGPPPTPNPEVMYPSIADLYRCTLELLGKYMAAYKDTPTAIDPHFTPDRLQIAYGTFFARYKYTKIHKRTDVAGSANAITDQGEGNTVASMQLRASDPVTVGNVAPDYQDQTDNRFHDYDLWTHYTRFTEIQASIQNAPANAFYQRGVVSPDFQSWSPPLDTLKNSISVIWSYLFDTMKAGFISGNLQMANPTDPTLPGFNDAMMAFKYIVPLIWAKGVCPSFLYRTGTTAAMAQQAMDAADPYCLFHFDQKSQVARQKTGPPGTQVFNVCAGLNMCEGRGWGGTGTKPGDSACSIADIHSCSGNNSCTYQGGCGFLSVNTQQQILPPNDQFIPGLNFGAVTGGCQTPIATNQVFDRSPKFPSTWTDEQKKPLIALGGTAVWTQARKIFAQRLGGGVDDLPQPRVVGSYDGQKRRDAVEATSK